MPKTLPPGVVKLGNNTFKANVVPDVFDARDLDYRPRLQPLPKVLDARPEDHFVLEQAGNSCTGHAVAAMINTVLAGQQDPVHVSPYMLYSLARRYDEFEGEDDIGSSLRGALKGWYYHGVLPDSDWPRLSPAREPDLGSDTALAELAMQRPLGAFYRVSALRLDDMQSAVNELSSIVASAAVHDGWVVPTRVERDGVTMHVIEKPDSAQPIGGHAFAIVGYNELGFLVQNSWGPRWGRKGFATLPYDDWLGSAYDAWVARPGVPSIVSQRTRTTTVVDTSGKLAEVPGPDLRRLAHHVVNLGNDGRLSGNGRFVSTPAQVDQIFTRMGDYHDFWRAKPLDNSAPVRRVVFYAHGGLTSEGSGLNVAQRQLSWWLNNRVYPITFAWQSGPAETLVDQLTDLVRDKLPFGAGLNLVEQADRLVEKIARSNVRWMWDEMKENAALAAKPARRPPILPGASLAVSRLQAYVRQLPAGDPLEVHLVGHSAGSIFLTGVLDRLHDAGIDVASLTYLAPAIRTDEWVRRVLPHLKSRRVARFASFGLNDKRELDDVCAARGVSVYRKSLLYLVSRALERTAAGEAEVPLVGMERFASTTVRGTSLTAALAEVRGDLVWAPRERPPVSRSAASSHGGIDDDGPTMTSVMLRVLGRESIADRTEFVTNAARTEPDPPEPSVRAVAAASAGRSAAGRIPKAREAPGSSSRIMDALEQNGWEKAT